MSDPNEPPRPEGSGDAPPPAPPPPPPPSGGDPYGGAASGAGGYGQPDYGGAGAGGYAGGTGGAGGYGAPPENPYGQPAPGAYSATDAWSFGWRQFTAKPATLLVPVLVVGIVLLVLVVIIEVVVDGALLNGNSGFGARLVAAGISGALISLVAQLLVAGLYKGALSVTDGQGFSLGQLFEGWDKVQVVIAGILIAVMTLIATLLCYFPVIIVDYFTQFTLLFVVGKQMAATDAIKASFRLCLDNLGGTILFFILAAITGFVGALICLVGLLVALPVVLVGLAYTFRRLQDEPVVEPAAKIA